jgi:hypothetical protein
MRSLFFLFNWFIGDVSPDDLINNQKDFELELEKSPNKVFKLW